MSRSPDLRPPRSPRSPGITARAASRVFRRLATVHRDERGTISILSVFTLLVFTFLLVGIVNVASHLDDKIRMQNSADAAAHSGGVILARGMNAIAFSNHLLCDVFAMTAFLREGRDRQSEPLTPEILDTWDRNAQRFSSAEFEKFKMLGDALTEKIQFERELVSAFSDMTEAASAFALPVFEHILNEQLIPQFQRRLVMTVPQLAQQSAAEVAIRNGLRRDELAQYPNLPQTGRVAGRSMQTAILWRMHPPPVDEADPITRTLPVVDPSPAGFDYGALPDADAYYTLALLQRKEIAKHYLEHWTQDKLRVFDSRAELSQFSRLWRIFTCGQLDKLLEEFPSTNLPMIIRQTETGIDLVDMRRGGMFAEVNRHLDLNFHLLAVVYREHLKEHGPGLFRNPLSPNSDALAFAQIELFVPRPRVFLWDGRRAPPSLGLGGTFGFDSGLDLPPQPAQGPVNPEDEVWITENWPTHWDALNQNWTVKLVPATNELVPQIIQQSPTSVNANLRPPRFGNATIRDLNQINSH